jgi:hypothetical protein
MKLPRWVSRLLLKTAVKMKHWEHSTNQPKPSETQKVALSICRKLIKDETSVLLIAPKSNKKYIENERLDIFIVIDGDEISIINHVYNYIIKLSYRDNIRINHFFDHETEVRRNEYEQVIKNRIEYSLHTILDKLES